MPGVQANSRLCAQGLRGLDGAVRIELGSTVCMASTLLSVLLLQPQDGECFRAKTI